MIGAIVVLYNPIKQEIENIKTYQDSVSYIVIVDNSTENNKNLVSGIVGHRENLIYYSRQKNMGLAKALNIGIGILNEKGCDWALVFDADSKLGSDIFKIYKNAIQDYINKSIAVFAPVHLFDRSKNKPYDGYKEIDWAMTSGSLFNIEIFNKQNGFFEDLFVDGLDMDYGYKSNENGYKVIECGNAIIIHHPAETKKCLGFKYGIASPYRYFMQTRQLIWCWKRYRKNRVLITYLYKYFKVIFLFPNKKEYIIEMNKGFVEGRKLWKSYKNRV